MKKNKIFSTIVVLFVALFMSCASYGPKPEDVYKPLNYSEDDVKKHEVERIKEIAEKNPVEALWRAFILKQSLCDTSDTNTLVFDVYNECIDKCVEKYNSYIEKKKYYKALSVYHSLASCSYEHLDSLSNDEASLRSLSENKLSPVTHSASDKVSVYIQGTVTIWVDRGYAVKNGAAYADIVIGSGFFISKDGYLITNNHVIADVVDPKNRKSTRLYIKLASDNDTRIPAKVIGYDANLDLALLKVEVDAPYVFNLGESSDLDIGDKVYAIGSPIGLDRTLTSGIVSAKDRKLNSIGNVFQIDAAVNQGNSGGPLIDEKGNVQAIVFAGMLQYEGLNFAIPVEYLKAELPILYSGGKRTHPWIGAFGKTKKELGKEIGVEIQYVMPGGSASRAGLKPGDVITAIDGIEITNNDMLQNIYMKQMPESVDVFTVLEKKDKEENAYNSKKVVVYLEKRPENPGLEVYKHDLIANSFLPLFGMKLKSVSTSSNKKFAVDYILKGESADESGFSENDSIEIGSIDFDSNSIIAQLYTKKRKGGYLDMGIMLRAALDSPYYF
ncbi:MAG: S1C family serine protease [Treponema sp.]|nr:S1C family serine protease [Treponema sp.]